MLLPIIDKTIITIDLDWAPKDAIEHTLEMLCQEKIQATIFTTDMSRSFSYENHEVALHPSSSNNTSIFESFDQLSHVYTSAQGVRSHSLETSGKFQSYLAQKKIRYTSNYLHFLQPNIRPLQMPFSLWELPIFYSDATALRFRDSHGIWEGALSLLSVPGLKVFCFHPIHIFINTFNFNHYESAKCDYHNSKKLIYHRYKGYGVRTIFQELIMNIGSGSYTCSSVVDFIENNSLDA